MYQLDCLLNRLFQVYRRNQFQAELYRDPFEIDEGVEHRLDYLFNKKKTKLIEKERDFI